MFAARFDFDWGNCPARVYAVPSNDLEFALLVDPGNRQYLAQLRLLKRVQADGKIVVEDKGVAAHREGAAESRRIPVRCTTRRWSTAC